MRNPEVAGAKAANALKRSESFTYRARAEKIARGSEELSVTPEGISVAKQPQAIGSTRVTDTHWWHDRALLGLLLLFVVLAPLVTQRIYASDEIQYFSYTHSLFFDQDLNFSNEYLHFYNSDKTKFADIYTDLYSKHEPATGLPINVAPIGTGLFGCLLCARPPGVLASRALGANVAADGYSQPYITASATLRTSLAASACLICYALGRKLFGKRVAAVSVVAMWLATPLIFYTVIAPRGPMPLR